MLYYEQAWHLVYFGEENTLFAEAPHAWVNGPVYPAIYYEYKDKVPGMCDHLKLTDFVSEDTNPMAEMKRLVDKMKLTPEEVEVTERVIMLYGSKTQNQLILLTHSEKPWSEQREGLAPYESQTKKYLSAQCITTIRIATTVTVQRANDRSRLFRHRGPE